MWALCTHQHHGSYVVTKTLAVRLWLCRTVPPYKPQPLSNTPTFRSSIILVNATLFPTGGVLSVTLLIVEPWQHCVCCIRSGVTQCTLLMVLHPDRMWQCWLFTVPWSHIGILLRSLAAEPRCIAGLLFPSQCPSGTILLTPYSMVWDWRVSRAGPMLFLLA